MYDLNQALQQAGLQEVNYEEFYRDIFPVGSFEKKGIYEQGSYNGIIVEVTDKKRSDGSQIILRHTLTDDLDKLDEVVSRDNFCITSPISYIGKSRKSSNARYIHAIAIDVDGISEPKNFNFLMTQIKRGKEMRCFVWGLPEPTYIVASGTGLHLYYVFEKPIPLFRNIVQELEKLKRRLTWQAWTQGATTLVDNIQYESLFQGFRIVGTKTKNGQRARAYRYGSGKKVTVEYLNFFVPADAQAQEFTYKSDLTLQQAKKKYPEWYERRIEEKRPKNTWMCNRALFEWWIDQIYHGAAQGHRYWCVMTLAVYAKKCGISYAELHETAIGMLDFLNSIGDGSDPFTIEDIEHALHAYDDTYMTYPIDTIIARTDISIQKNKRNYRKQAVHVKIMSSTRDILYPDGEWRNKDGRPTKQQIVKEWQRQNPAGKKADCIRQTGLAKHTVYKWWE